MLLTLLRPVWVSDKGKKVKSKKVKGKYSPNRLAVRGFLYNFAADFIKGCSLVRAEMIPSYLIRVMPT